MRTLLQQAQEALAETERWLRAVADAAGAALLISRWDDGALLYTNQQFRDLVCLGSEAEAEGRFASEFYVNPAEGAALRETVAAQAEAARWEGEFRRLDGTRFRAVGTVQCSTYKGEKVLFATSRSIAEVRLEAGAKHRASTGTRPGVFDAGSPGNGGG